jgi:hypothetical protein
MEENVAIWTIFRPVLKGGIGALLLSPVWGVGPVETQLLKVVGDRGVVEKPVPKGEVGILLCPYSKGEIICGYLEGVGGRQVQLFPYTPLKNEAMALPVVPPKPGDRALFGKDYNRVIVIAPDQRSYLQLVQLYRDRGNTIIPSDLIVTVGKVERDQFPTPGQLRQVAESLNVGRYIFLGPDGVEEVDAFSLTPIGRAPFQLKASQYRVPFFTTYSDWEEFPGNLLPRYRELFQFRPLPSQ